MIHTVKGLSVVNEAEVGVKQAIMYAYNNKNGLKSQKQIQCKFKINLSQLQVLYCWITREAHEDCRPNAEAVRSLFPYLQKRENSTPPS